MKNPNIISKKVDLKERVELALKVIEETLTNLPELPLRMDEMNNTERGIANIACELCGSIKYIKTLLENEVQTSYLPNEHI